MKKALLFLAGLALAQGVIAQNGAQFIGSSIPPVVAPGATFNAIVGMLNSGSTSWTTAGGYALGSENPRNNANWIAGGRVALPMDPVQPNDIAYFDATFTAPTVPGIYNFAWSMVQTNVGWFGPIASQQIRVGNGHFTPGDLVLLQATPTASDTIINSGTAIVLKNFSPSSLTTTFQVALPITGQDALVTGNSAFTGMIDLSSEGSYVVVGGYGSALPSGVNLEAAPSSIPRAIGTVNSVGQFVLNASTTTGFTGGTFRGAVSDGLGNFWAGAQNSGIYYFGTNYPARQTSTLGTGTGVGAIRNMIMVNGRPYFSTSQYPAPNNFGIAAFPSVAPVNPEDPTLVLNTGNAFTGLSGTPSPKGFCFNTNLTIAYVVDLRAWPNGGIYRYNGTGTGLAGSWTYAYNITNNLLTAGGFFQDVVADFSGPNPRLYATAGGSASVGGTNLVSAVDTGAATTKFTLLSAAPAGSAYRGLSFAPKLVSVSITRNGSDVTVRWPGGGVLYSASNVAGPYVPVDGAPSSPYTTAASTAQFYAVGYP